MQKLHKGKRRGVAVLGSVRGQTLVEAIVALSILVTGFLGLLGLLSHSFYLNRVIANNYIGTYLAGEGIEIVKNILDHNIEAGIAPWNTGFANGDYQVDYASLALSPYVPLPQTLNYNAGSHLYGYGAGTATAFNRRIRIALVGTDEVDVQSIVTWSTGLSQSSINLSDEFFRWRL